MNDKKRIAFLTQRNNRLLKENKELQIKVTSYSENCNEVTELRKELKDKIAMWNKELDILKYKKSEYEKLLKELKDFRKSMIYMNPKIPWYKKIFMR